MKLKEIIELDKELRQKAGAPELDYLRVGSNVYGYMPLSNEILIAKNWVHFTQLGVKK
jgi:hypothetical protein